MRYSIKERLYHLMKKRTPSKNEAEILRTKIWLKNIMQNHGVGRQELSKLIDTKGNQQEPFHGGTKERMQPSKNK